ncbi:hypothetical protein AJ79_10159 [Helicocarpus griseus UAMH5409]|uniref:Uncharacterized protein n=1 Tax=Helicocarpus griseus UAMH5409 TaxID=1447875 RepID=A0A2B7WF90_9EURO|nr:hypothetical protein AJ79_10159 [Helicocarpus griseus UAMH5409]
MESATQPAPTPAPRARLPPKQVDCKWWKRGHCRRGSECYFRHDEALAGVDKLPERPTAGPVNNVNNGAAVADATAEQAAPTAANPSQENLECGICMENPTIFGLLINCDHIFCLDCIRGWRSSVGNTAEDVVDSADTNVSRKATKTCPLCRVKSEYVVPSSVFPTPPEAPTSTAAGETASTNDSTENERPDNTRRPANPAKAKIIDKYLARLKAIPCRYFEESIQRWQALPLVEDPSTGCLLPPKFSGECLFGNECHFAHIHPLTKEPYIFTKKEITTMKRANHARRAREIRRAIRGQRRMRGHRELHEMLEAMSVEDGYASSTSDYPAVLEDNPDILMEAGVVFYDMLAGPASLVMGEDDEIFD